MKDSEDKNLQDYLEGTDQVSATYQSVSDEKPSAALDAAILQAARESVADKAIPKKTIPVQAYSIAASICVAVLAVSLFLNNEAELLQNEIGEIEALSIQLSDMPIDETVSADEAAPLLQTDGNPNTVNTVNTANIQSAETNADAVAAEARLERSRTLIQERQAESANLEEAAAFSTQAESDLGGLEQPAAQLEMAASLAPAADFSYRQNPDSWLAEIQRLTEAGNTQAYEQERSLFAETYPDIDIDSALSELTETD